MRPPNKDDVSQMASDQVNSGTRVVHGSGKFVFPNGAVYAGEWCLIEEFHEDLSKIQNVDVNHGSVGNPNSLSNSGALSVVNNVTLGLKQRHGFGRYQHGPDLYVGWWSHDKMHGRGRYESNSGCYEGEFVNGQFSGNGSFQWASRAYYTGEWKMSKMHGKGVFVSHEGVRWEGVFQNDYFVNREGTWIVPNVDQQQVWIDNSDKEHPQKNVQMATIK